MRSRTRTAPTLLLLALALCAAAGCTKVQMGEDEKELILRARDVAPYGLNVGDTSRHESFTKTVYFDRSYQLEYEFRTPEEPGLDPLYMSVNLTFERSVADAKLAQGAERMGISAGSYIDGMKMEERKGFFQYGDESAYYVLLSKDGVPGGFYFVTRHGTKVYSVLLAGALFEAEGLAELLTPKLQKFSAHGPRTAGAEDTK